MTRQEIVSKYMIKPQYILNTCSAYYLELHNNGHSESVLNFLLKGDGAIGKQGVTYDFIKNQLCSVESKSFNDNNGQYAGTHYTYLYAGQKVYESTSWSLF